MGMFDQLRAAQEMMKSMSPDQIQELMKQAQESKGIMEETVKKLVESEIQKRGLVTREEVMRIVRETK